jgi:hypothetical protein
LILEIIQVAAIQNYGSSGSTFLHSLLDGHPDVIQMPGLYARNLYKFWNCNHTLTIDKFVSAFLDAHKPWFVTDLVDSEFGFRSMGDNMDQTITIDQDLFEGHFRTHFTCQNYNSREFIIQCHKAYNFALGKKNKGKKLLVLPLHTLPPDEYHKMFADFPDLKIVNMVRHPVSLYYSALKHYDSMHRRSKVLNFNFTEAALSFLFNDYHYGQFKRYETFGFRYFPESKKEQQVAIVLEELHKNPSANMKSLATWLTIPWSNTLLASTFNGQRWWSRAESSRINGFVKNPDKLVKNKNGWKIDELRIEYYTRHQMKEWGYTGNQLNKCIALFLILVPFKSEYTSLQRRFQQIPRTFIRAFSAKPVIKQHSKFIKNRLGLQHKKTIKYSVTQFVLYSISAFIIPFYSVKDYFKIRYIILATHMRLESMEKENVVKKLLS